MKCPKCPETVLVMTERQSVEIDYCPVCRGVWLDRGELDKLVERSAVAEAPRAPASPSFNGQRQPSYSQDRDEFSSDDYRSGKKQYSSRKKSWLGEIFD